MTTRKKCKNASHTSSDKKKNKKPEEVLQAEPENAFFTAVSI